MTYFKKYSWHELGIAACFCVVLFIILSVGLGFGIKEFFFVDCLTRRLQTACDTINITNDKWLCKQAVKNGINNNNPADCDSIKNENERVICKKIVIREPCQSIVGSIIFTVIGAIACFGMLILSGLFIFETIKKYKTV